MERLGKELAAKGRYIVIQQFEEGDVAADFEVLAHRTDTFILTEGLP